MRQNKWLEKFENLLCVLDTEEDKKAKNMLEMETKFMIFIKALWTRKM